MPTSYQLAEIFRDTMQWIRTDPALSAAAAASAAGTVLYRAEDTPALPDFTPVHTKRTVTPMRSFESARWLRGVYPDARIAVHNFASATHPGGGVVRGAAAQEECLCRCSTLYPALDTPELAEKYYKFHQSRHDTRYTDAVIWTPDVRVIKTDELMPERLPVPEHFAVDILTCAAPNLSWNKLEITEQELYALHVRRLRKLLTVAAAQGDEVLVLGAFGCGAFRNPPAVVSAAYRAVLPEFEGRFLHIDFAIPKDLRGSRNFEAFCAALA